MTSIPSQFVPIVDYSLFLTLYAKGTQNYQCNGTAWELRNANAELWDNSNMQGNIYGRHYFLDFPDVYGGRPTWISEKDQSSVTVKMMKSVPVEGAIPLLQTNMTSTAGEGVFSDVSMVLRMNTKNGKAPKLDNGCVFEAIEKVPYTSEYWYYKKNIDSIDLVSSANALGVFTSTILISVINILF